MKYTQTQWSREVGWGEVPDEYASEKTKEPESKKPKRRLLLDGLGVELELGRVVQINTDKKMIYIEEMNDGKWRFTYSSAAISDIKDLIGIQIIREN